MSIAEFVSDLRTLDVRLSANGQRLRLKAPKGVLTDSLRAQIAERKQELLRFLSDYERSARFIPPPILRRTSSDPAPLSFAQERLWFLAELEPGSAVYNICRASRVTGQLNIAALESSLSETVRRHEILRSQIRVIDGRPMQITTAAPKFQLNFNDLRSLKGSTLDDEIRCQMRAEAERQFDFAAGLFLRATLLRIRDDKHILILTTHHIVSDAWSRGILTRELWSLYEACAKGGGYALEDLPIQYSDFAAWQREWLQGEILESQLAYWKKQLTDIPILNLPTDHPRPVRQTSSGARVPIILSESLTAAINDLSYRFNVTPFMSLLAAIQVLLYRYSGQEDVIVGTPVANRSRSELESLIGFFVNTLVLRADLSGGPSFKELLARVSDVCLGAYAHEDLPFERLVEDLKPERDQSRNPLFQVMFVLQNTTRPFSGMRGLRIEPIEMATTRSQFDLSLFLRERERKYIGYVEYRTDLFNRGRIQRMIGHFQTLLEGIAADPEQSISTLPLLREAERQQLLVEWNATEAEHPKDSCIHELFEAQVERTSEAVAVQFDGKQLTYRELNSRTNQLARYLQGLGVGPEKLVGICVERSLEMVVSLLGILKAGGAYVPLDPAYPRDRLEFMLKDAQVSILLTQQKIIEDGKWRPVLNETEGIEDGDSPSSILDSQIRVVCLDTNWEAIAGESQQNPRSEVKPDNLAYVIYTSGSTGQPKGVAIEHRNTVALLYWAKSVFSNDELAGVLASTSICFDLSVFELFVPLSWGGKVMLAENAFHLHSIAEKNELTLINTVPPVMAQLLAMGGLPASVQTVNLAGEALRSDLVKQIYESTNVKKVYDLYGPSETTTYSTFRLRTAEGSPTIGRPISNTRIYILDRNFQPVPIGVPGELYIAGAGVARGYLNRPDLTTERFISSSFDGNGVERIYRTGDSARYRPEGDIEFLGRADNQIKIHGYRIELGEIEAVLTKHKAVKDCVVVVCEHAAWTGKNLVAYVVPREHSVLAATELRSYLKEKLPEYMVPSVFVNLDALPLMPNGKVDRSKLSMPNNATPQLTGTFLPPRDEIEQLIAQIWKDVLNVENIGVHDNFFELGGHSLLAVRIVARLRDAFNREVPLGALFETPTIAGLASCIEGFIRGGHTPDLPPILPVPREGPLRLSMNQEHLWNLDQLIPGTHFFNMPYVYHLRGHLNLCALEKTLTEIVRRHEALRTVFTKIDGHPVQFIKDGSDFRLCVEDLRTREPDEVSQKAGALILEERERSFDLATGPLLRTKLLRLKDKEHFLLLTMHHIVSDHWSMQLILRELALLYSAFSEEGSSPLGKPPIQLADYACWERRLLESGLLNDQLSYWKQQLMLPIPKLEFQQNGKPEKEMNFRAASLPLEFDETLVAGIRLLAVRENCTPFMVLVTALTIVLFRLTDARDIRIGTLISNRRRREIGDVVGHFLNTVILCTQVSPDMNCMQLLKRVREACLSAYLNQELPFEQLARIMEQEKNIQRTSLFQILLSYQDSAVQVPQLPGLTIAPLILQRPIEDSEVTLTTYDLIFRLRETSSTLTGSVNYKTDTVDIRVAKAIDEGLTAVLNTVVLNSEQRISNLAVYGQAMSPSGGGV